MLVSPCHIVGTRKDGPQRELVGYAQSSSPLLYIPGNKLEIDFLAVTRFGKLNRSQEIGTDKKNDIKVYLVAVITCE